MSNVTEIITWEGLAFLVALFAVVLMQILTGGLRTQGLIEGTTARGRRFVSAGRTQLLIVTMVAAVNYLTQVWQSPQKFPEIPQNWLLFFGGSQVLYLGNKLLGKRNNRFHI
jgi:hypothetical protein